MALLCWYRYSPTLVSRKPTTKRKGSVFSSLYQSAMQKKDELRRKQEAAGLEECTFRPKIRKARRECVMLCPRPPSIH